MGSQQLLLIAVGLVLIAIMVAIGIFMFRDQSAATNRDAISNDLAHLASRAQDYFRKPRIFGGGGATFNGLTMRHLTSRNPNLNGLFSLEPDPVTGSPAYITITGEGTETGTNGSKVFLAMTVWPDSVGMDLTRTN